MRTEPARTYFEKAVGLLMAAEIPLTEAEYWAESGGRWLIGLTTKPQVRLLWDGTDRSLHVQMSQDPSSAETIHWHDVWMAREPWVEGAGELIANTLEFVRRNCS